jgi:hypothetical protein
VLSVFLCDELCSFVVWNADASAARAWMYRQPQEDWENFLSGVNGFLNQAEVDISTNFHRKEISGMYLNIFYVFQGAMTRERFAVATIPSPTTKISTMVRTVLINIFCTVC